MESFDKDTEYLIIKQICSSSKKWKEIRNSNVINFIYAHYGAEKLNSRSGSTREFKSIDQGKPIDLRYERDKVYLRSPIQKFYDIKEHPRIVFGQCVVMLNYWHLTVELFSVQTHSRILEWVLSRSKRIGGQMFCTSGSSFFYNLLNNLRSLWSKGYQHNLNNSKLRENMSG